MFAILISDETLPKIKEAVDLDEQDIDFIITCCNKHRYFVTGMYSRGEILPWTFIPRFTLVNGYKYDEEKIKTDWDQIVPL